MKNITWWHRFTAITLNPGIYGTSGKPFSPWNGRRCQKSQDYYLKYWGWRHNLAAQIYCHNLKPRNFRALRKRHCSAGRGGDARNLKTAGFLAIIVLAG